MHYAYITSDSFLLQITSSPSVPLPFLSSCLPLYCLISLHSSSESYCKYSTTLSAVFTVYSHRKPILFYIFGPQEIAPLQKKCSSDLFWDYPTVSGTCRKHITKKHNCLFWCIFLAAVPLEITISHKLTNRAPTFRRLFPFNKMAL